MKPFPQLAALLLATAALPGCATMERPASAAAAEPAATERDGEDAVVAGLLSRMSVERKVAQLIQPQINSFTPEDMARYRFGSYLNGGNGGPGGDEYAPASEWLALADTMYDASVRPLPGGEPAVPTMWGTDAVHGHSNIVGATLFPHNIGLGATGDAGLVQRIGAATAAEIAVTGIDWNFSPTVAVARDDRWGRTYESYSENPDIVATMGAALVRGLQGEPADADYLHGPHVIATAKHFFGDGGTTNGVDQGDVNGDIDALLALHGRPYPAAIDAGVAAIMASFNSVNGRKMHGNAPLLTDVLRGQMGFDGLVVGDWNGHGQIAGCTVTDCPQALLAGLDIYMVPDDWKGLLDTLIAQVNDGTIPAARLDEAVGRVLRVKYRAGLLGPDARRPSARPLAGRYAMLASPEHRALAREAVAKSQVILKNDGVLPIRPSARVVVAGSGANDIAKQSGGWSLTWQGGGDLTNARFPNASTIFDGIASHAQRGGGTATLSESDGAVGGADVAIVVFGEDPYAEFAGDRTDLAFRDEAGLNALRRFRAAGVPTVAVFLSGRPLWVNRELNASDAFVASWLPGSEGAGIADVLYGTVPATGRLSFSWPARCAGMPVNGGDGTLFPLGYGRDLSDTAPLAPLSEECAALAQGPSAQLFGSGRLAQGVVARAGEGALPNLIGSEGGITARGYDRDAQEDAREIRFAPGSRLVLEQPAEAAPIASRIR
ncbi:glycoside hydrolase family 3 protein [Croceicoccus sp. YJ47]|uniref:glycoside hydrolase family 3 protein n=1 Tax=Croceicoccus sp. YJ47 TaxID=2798724 RepID=UPI001F2BAE28|nr:glycoside hydrolase family 3 protein [Croceicoccus sp. YJ47]